MTNLKARRKLQAHFRRLLLIRDSGAFKNLPPSWTHEHWLIKQELIQMCNPYLPWES